MLATGVQQAEMGGRTASAAGCGAGLYGHVSRTTALGGRGRLIAGTKHRIVGGCSSGGCSSGSCRSCGVVEQRGRRGRRGCGRGGVQGVAAGAGAAVMTASELGGTQVGGRRRTAAALGRRARLEQTGVEAQHIEVSGRGRLGEQECVMRWRHQGFKPFHDHGR